MEDLGSIRRMFDEHHLKYGETDGTALYVATKARNSGTIEMLVMTRSPGVILVAPVASMLLAVAPEQVTDVLRLVNHLNAHRVPWGAFWVNPDLGWLWFQLAVPAIDGLRANDLLTGVSILAHTVDEFTPCFASLLWDGPTLQAAAAQNEPEASDEEHGLVL